MNFAFGQENLEFCSKSGRSLRNLYHFGCFKVFLTFIEHLNKKPEKYVKHVMFFVQISMFRVSEICSRSGKRQEIYFIPMCGYT